MNKGIKTALFFIVSMLISVNSNAVKADYYLGLGLGHSSFSYNTGNIVADNQSLSNTSEIGKNASALSVFAGLPLDEHLSLELDFISSGDVSASDGSRKIKLFDVSTLAITTVLSKKVSENATIFGKLGVHMWDISESFGDLDTINNAVDLTYGFGTDLNLYGSHDRQLRLQWNHYEYDGVYIKDNDILSISLLLQLGNDY